jgi:WD40 repeat protein
VVSFLRDAKRFVLSCRWVVDTAPLQLYASAIVFAPERSVVRQTFKKYLPEWISLLPDVDSDWNAVLQTLEGHTSWVKSVVFSNDGTLIASGSDDNTIKIWNVATGEEEQTLEGHTNTVSSVVFSNDGTLIASGSWDMTIKIWNVATGKEEQTLEGHIEPVNSVVFSNDGTLIASGSYDMTIKIWNMAMGKEEQTLEGHADMVNSVVFSNDGMLIASGSYDKTIKIWNVATGKEEQTLEGHMSWVSSVVFSNDGTLIASGSRDKTIKIWNVAMGKEEQTLKGHTSWVSSVVFSNDGTLIASGSRDKTIKIWNVATGNNVKSFDSSRFTDVLSFTDHDSILVTSTGYFSLEFPDVSTPQPSKRDPELCSPEVQGEADGKLGFGINHDETWITAGGPDGRKVLWLPPGFRPKVSAISTEPGGSVVVISCPSGRVVIMGFRR